MKRTLRVGLFAWATLASPLAHADNKAACIAAASEGQKLRDIHKLVEARDQFRVCAQEQCPRVVASDCAGWLEAAETSLPTVVITATDASGKDIFDARVQVDGRALTTRLDGQAVPMNPGLRMFHLELADGSAADQAVQVREGEKNQRIAVVLKGPTAPARAMGAPVQRAETVSSSESPATVPLSTSMPSHGPDPWRTVGWVGVGVGLGGLAVGGVFGVMATADKSAADCKDNFCKAGPLASAREAATIADVGLAAGGGLLAVGIGFVLLSPSANRVPAARVMVTPLVARSGAGVSVVGICP